MTSFDIELEMAMWRTGPKKASYFVVVPVHLFPENQYLAEPVWLRGEIHKNEDVRDELKQIRSPDNWELLTSTTAPEKLTRVRILFG